MFFPFIILSSYVQTETGAHKITPQGAVELFSRGTAVYFVSHFVG